MAWALTAVGVSSVLVGVLALAAAGAVHMASLRQLQNRRLATFLLLNAATILVVTQVASEFLNGALGGLVSGPAAGAMLLAARPIERAPRHFAERATPRVQDTAKYRTVRRREEGAR